MPISPEFITRLAGQVLAYAGSAEVAVTRAVAWRIGAGIDQPEWAAQKLLGVRALQEELLKIATQFTTDVTPAVESAVGAAADAGQRTARGELYAALKHLEPKLPNLQALIELAAEALEPVTGGAATSGILRAATDAYRAVVAEATSHVVSGSLTRRQAAQRALNRWATRGVVAFVDRRGREWDMVSYTEMATRSASQRAMIAAHGATLRNNGVNLVIVSNAPQECKRCRPWEGKVLTLGPSDGRHRSLADAQAAGFMHPGCRHSIGAYIPGFTEPHAGPTADPEGDKARQRLRELERRVRAARRLEAAALDDDAKRAAQARVRAIQSQIREHLSTGAGTTLQRQPARERIGAAR